MVAIARHHGQESFVLTNRAELKKSGWGQSPKFGVLLAELDGEIAGYASYTGNYSIWLGSSYMNIDDAFVWKAFRGQKLGEALMFKAREVCKWSGVQRLKWEVGSAAG